MHGRVPRALVCTAECHAHSCARPSARVKRVHGQVHGHMHGPAVCDDGLDGRTALRFVRLGSDIHFARLGWAHGSVGRGARLGRDVSTVRGHVARIGCTRAKLYGHD